MESIEAKAAEPNEDHAKKAVGAVGAVAGVWSMSHFWGFGWICFTSPISKYLMQIDVKHWDIYEPLFCVESFEGRDVLK